MDLNFILMVIENVVGFMWSGIFVFVMILYILYFNNFLFQFFDYVVYIIGY